MDWLSTGALGTGCQAGKAKLGVNSNPNPELPDAAQEITNPPSEGATASHGWMIWNRRSGPAE
jgi:hypothetical protein